MRRGRNVMILAVFLATAAYAKEKPPSKDLTVIGRLSDQTYRHVDIPDDLLGHGDVTARLKIVRVIAGHPPTTVLTVRYFAHTYLVEDKDFRFKLRRNAEGLYLICVSPGANGYQCR